MNPQYQPWLILSGVLAVLALIYSLRSRRNRRNSRNLRNKHNGRSSRAGRSRFSYSLIIPHNHEPPQDTETLVCSGNPISARKRCPDPDSEGERPLLTKAVWREEVGNGGGTEVIGRSQEQDWLSEFGHLLPEGADKSGGDMSV